MFPVESLWFVNILPLDQLLDFYKKTISRKSRGEEVLING